MNKRKFLTIISIIIITAMLFCGFAITISNSEPAEKVTFYLVTNGSERDKNKAISDAVTVKTRGGAGYLYSSNGKNFVVLCCYSDAEDANAVAKRIQNSQVVELKISISQNPSKATTQKLGIAISNKLYDLSVDFDTGKIDAKALRKSLEQVQVEFDSKIKKMTIDDKIEQAKLLEIVSAIDDLITCNEDFLDWNMKHQRVKILDNCKGN